MDETWNFFRDNLWPHMPFLAGYISFVFIGEFAKAQIWTKRRATKGKFFHFMRRTLAFHAPAFGLLLGAIPGLPASPGVDSVAARMLYWFVCGVMSSWSFHAIADYLKKKYGVDLEGAIEDAVNPSMTPSSPPDESE